MSSIKKSLSSAAPATEMNLVDSEVKNNVLEVRNLESAYGPVMATIIYSMLLNSSLLL